MSQEWINKITCGDTLSVLKEMPSDFVDTIVTSPPFEPEKGSVAAGLAKAQKTKRREDKTWVPDQGPSAMKDILGGIVK